MQTILDHFAHGAATRLDADTCSSVTVSQGGSVAQVASNDARAAACDQVEVRDHAGPCITAMNDLQSVLIPDIDGDHRWPEWRQTALDNGFRSFVALPGYVDDHVTVGVNTYSEQSFPPWSAEQIVALDVYAQQLAAELRAVAHLHHTGGPGGVASRNLGMHP